MLGGKPWSVWIEQVRPQPRAPCQSTVSHGRDSADLSYFAPLFLAALFVSNLWWVPLTMFVVGWALQFAGHAVEGKPPEFLRDWRFLFVGLRWWFAKVRGRA